MPSSASAEEKPRKSAPRKRAPVAKRTVRKTAAKTTVRKRATNKRVAAKTAPKRVSAERNEARVARKAPTPIAASKASDRAKRKQLLIIFSVIIISIGISAGVGFTDTGQINVNQTIEDRNERIRSGQLGENDTQRILVPVQNTEANKLPDGGLIGLGVGAEPPAPEPEPEPATTTASSTASTTEETASSTEESNNEDVTELKVPDEEADVLEEVIEPEPTTGSEVTDEPISGR